MTFGSVGGHSPLFIQGSNWGIENIIEVPLDSVTNDPAFLYINCFSLVFRVVVQLERLFVKKKNRTARKFGEDQHNIFKSLEKSLQHTGINGKDCLLRTICEMQQVPLNHYSIMGEIIMALLTPKRGTGNMMVDYLEAEKLGQADPEACSSAFSGCPVSLFNMMRTYSTPADKPHDHQHSRDDNNQHNQKGGKRADSSVQDDSGRLDLVEDRNGMDDIISLDMF